MLHTLTRLKTESFSQIYEETEVNLRHFAVMEENTEEESKTTGQQEKARLITTTFK